MINPEEDSCLETVRPAQPLREVLSSFGDQAGAVVDQADRIREALQNPIESVTLAIGRNLDSNIHFLVGERLAAGDK